jgi:hypothetical protein
MHAVDYKKEAAYYMALMNWKLRSDDGKQAVLDVGDGVFEVRSTAGDTRLGGDDFDQKIVDYVAEEFRKDQGIDLRKDKQAMQRLREAAEKETEVNQVGLASSICRRNTKLDEGVQEKQRHTSHSRTLSTGVSCAHFYCWPLSAFPNSFPHR